MIRIGCSTCLIVLIIFGTTFDVIAQKEISTEGLDLGENPSLWYDQQMGVENTPLQMGIWNPSERRANLSHQYFFSRSWQMGTISYRGQVYTNVPMLYDTFEDIVLVRQEGLLRFISQPMEIIKSQVSYFEINSSHFEYFESTIENFSESYFEVLYRNERVELLAKRLKKIEIVSSTDNSYVERDRFYMRLKGDYVQIYRNATIIRQYKEYRPQIKSYIRKNKINVAKPGTSDQLVRLVQYCDQISTK